MRSLTLLRGHVKPLADALGVSSLCATTLLATLNHWHLPCFPIPPLPRYHWPQVMLDPVVLCATGQVYEYCSLKNWFRTSNRLCPKTNIEVLDVQVGSGRSRKGGGSLTRCGAGGLINIDNTRRCGGGGGGALVCTAQSFSLSLLLLL